IILLAGSLLAISLASGTALLRLRIRQRGTSSIYTTYTPHEDDNSTVIPNIRGVWVSAIMMFISFLVAFTLIAVVPWGFLLTGLETSPWMMFQALFSTAFVIGVIWVFRKVKQGLFAQGGLTLSPSGVTYKAWGPTRHIPWYAAEFVFTYPGDCNIALSYDSNQVTVPLKQKDDTLPFSGQLLAIDPALAYYTLDFYLNHPE